MRTDSARFNLMKNFVLNLQSDCPGILKSQRRLVASHDIQGRMKHVTYWPAPMLEDASGWV